MTAAMISISRSLTSPGFDLAGSLALFVRDEVRLKIRNDRDLMLTVQLLTWTATYQKQDPKNDTLSRSVAANVDLFLRRVTVMGYIAPNIDKVGFQLNLADSQGPEANPIVTGITTLINSATSPSHLAAMGENYLAWY